MILENIAKAIEKSGRSRYQIAKDTGVDQAVLCRIVSGGSCSIETADILCKYLELIVKNVSQDKESKKMGVIKRTKAMNIQLGITQRLNKLREQEKLTPKDFDYLDKRTHELYNLAKEADKLKEIKKIIEK